jgi:dTDP-4-dehydrorhamnose reductase
VGGFTRIYVAGAGGMLGDAVVTACREVAEVRATDREQRASWLGVVDVADQAAFAADVEAFDPDLIVNLAAETDLEFCELNPDRAHASNTLGAIHGGQIATRLDVRYVYISTAGIFGGEKDVFDDGDEPNPLTVYARTKLAGEQYVTAEVPRHLVLRPGWMMGGGPDLDKKFVNKVYRQIIGGANRIHAVTDRLGSPTYTHDFARGLLTVAATDLSGTYNQVCHGDASRYDVAAELVELLGLGDEVEVVPVTSDHFATEYFAERPASEQLANTALAAVGLDTMRHWRDALADYAQVFRQDLDHRRLVGSR